MKQYKLLFYLLMFLPLVLSFLSLPFMPERIPVHFSDAGIADRWGSKYEALVIPSFSVITGFIILYFNREIPENTRGRIEACSLFSAGLCLFLVFNIMSIYYLPVYFTGMENLNGMKIELTRLIVSVFAFIILIFSFLVPRIEYENIPGLRLRWSEKRAAMWKCAKLRISVQLFCTAVLIFLAAYFTKAMLCLVLSLLVFSASVIVFIIYNKELEKKF